MVAQPFKAGVLVPRVKTLGYHQPSLRDSIRTAPPVKRA